MTPHVKPAPCPRISRKERRAPNHARVKPWRLVSAATFLALLLSSDNLHAQTFEHLYTDNTGNIYEGGLIKGPDGAFYGTTQTGGTCDKGTIFKVLPNGHIVTLFSFNGRNGAKPVDGLTMDELGNIYGATKEEGLTQYGGTIFRLSPDGEFRTLAENAGYPTTPLLRAANGDLYGAGGLFGFNVFRLTAPGKLGFLQPPPSEGEPPTEVRGRLLLASDGNIYGVTRHGGRNFSGTVFKITPSGTIRWLHHFSNSEGLHPEGPLVEMGGKLFGVTNQGGTDNKGTVYSLTFSGTHTVLESFRGANGDSPFVGLSLGSDGNAYGSTAEWGPNAGSIFRVTPQGSVSVVSSFRYTTPLNAPRHPRGPVIDGGDGFLYGICPGQIYRLDPGGAASTFARFDQAAGKTPLGGLILEPGGTLLGSTLWGGTYGKGTIVRSTLSGQFTRAGSFPSSWGGVAGRALVSLGDGRIFGTAFPGYQRESSSSFLMDAAGAVTILSLDYGGRSGLTLGGDGNLYGSSASGNGFLFKVTPGGSVTPVIQNDNWDFRLHGLTYQGDGSFLAAGYEAGAGAIYSLGMDGGSKILASFDGANGRYPESELVKGPDGAWYGTTRLSDVPGGGGVVYRFSPEAGITTLWNFKTTFRASSVAQLLRDEWGNFRGTTHDGGTAGKGTVFKMSADRELVTMHSFSGADGASPRGGLANGPRGSHYGMTSEGGKDNAGTIFKISANGTFTSLLAFNYQNGASPQAALAVGSDGNFYGTTSLGGQRGAGTVFRMTPGGVLTTLYHFPNNGYSNGRPMAELTEGNDGAFYGTTAQGGEGMGSVFRITKAGDFTTLHAMNPDGSEGGLPHCRLEKNAVGDFYGTCTTGEDGVSGSVFRITPSGVFTTLALFRGDPGTGPKAGLLLGEDGNFYGSTVGGGPGDENTGTVFRITPAGQLTTLKKLGTSDALSVSNPVAALTDGGDGYFYGTAGNGLMDSRGGKIFRISPSEAFDVVAEFSKANGEWHPITSPSGGLAVGPDGHLYGATEYGGKHGLGSLFRLSLSGDMTTLYSFDGNHSAIPVGTPVFAPDGNLYGAANQLSIWRLNMPPAFTGPAKEITARDAVLTATVFPDKTNATPAFLEYSTRPDMAGAIRVGAGTLPGGGAPRDVSVTLSGLSPDTVYYYRAVSGPAEHMANAKILTFATLTGLQAWRQRFFGTVSDSGTAADMADPDSDGLVNLLEYALSGNPMISTPAPGQLSRDGSGWRFIYARNASAILDGVVCKAQFSSSLPAAASAWSSGPLTETITADAENGESEMVSVSLSDVQAGRGFLRILVSQE